jgi:hypothetical protein
MRMKPQDADMGQHASGAFAAIHAQPGKTPGLVSHAVVRGTGISIAATSGPDGGVRSCRVNDRPSHLVAGNFGEERSAVRMAGLSGRHQSESRDLT